MKILVDDILETGVHRVNWDATNNTGKHVSSGYYFYVLRTSNKLIARKMAFIKQRGLGCAKRY